MFISGPGFTFQVGLLGLGFEVSLLYIYIYILLYFQCRGMERTYEAPSNEAPHMILGYHQGRLVTYLQHHFIFRQWRPAKPSTGMSFFNTALLSQSGNAIVFGILSCIRTHRTSGKDKEKTSLRFSHSESSKHACQFYWGVLCT